MDMIPERNSLVTQTAEILRETLRSGEWSDHLPTEAQLQERMQVGRNTVRAALAILTREGWISEGRPGVRRSILHKKTKQPSAQKTHVVSFLAPDALERARSQVVLTVGGLRDHLSDLNYRLEIHTSKAFRLDHPERTLASLVRKTPSDLWVLHLSTRAMQEWFVKNKIPSLIYGSAHEGIPLPCVDFDYSAITRHAVGQLLGKGHRRLALILPDLNLYGNERAVAAFKEALHAERDASRQGQVIRIPEEGSVAVKREIERAMRRQNPPTGLIVWHVRYAIAAYCCLQGMGRSVPGDVSIVCNDDGSAAEWLLPSLARYQVPQSTIIHRLFRPIHEILTAGAAPEGRITLLPDFLPGQSIAPPPGAG